MTATSVGEAGASTARKAGVDDVGGMLDVLVRAFDDDPVMNWFVRQDDQRVAALRRFFDVGVRQLTLPHDEVYVTADGAGVAVWAPPGGWELDEEQLEPLLPAFVEAFGEGRLERSLRGLEVMGEVHPHEPHYYLLLLGVDPARQGRGIGSALLRDMLRRCDADDVPAYLEATTPRNRALYERHGFRVTDTIRLPGGPPLWLMWRRPQVAPTNAGGGRA